MNEDLLIIKLRDCFTAGYTLPQFCIDNNIKKPLFVALDERRADFFWEIYVQFKYDKRITPKFALLNGKKITLNFFVASVLPTLNFENLPDINWNEHDAIIVLNAVRFNVNNPRIIYFDQLTDYFIRRTYAEIPLLHFLQRNPKVKLIVTNFPTSDGMSDTDFESKLLTSDELREKLRNNKNVHIPTLYDKIGYNNLEVLAMMTFPKIKSNFDGSTYFEDNDSPFIGSKNGKRMTAYQPEQYENCIYFVGGCHQYGVDAPFDKTIESYLQKMLNEKNLPYRVENESQLYVGRQQDLFYNLNKLTPNPDDIIFVYTNNIIQINLPFLDMSRVFDSYDHRTIWVVKRHVNEIGYKILAEKYFQFLLQNNFFKNTKIEYSAPPRRLIATAYRKKILLPRQNFSIRQSWRSTKNLCANGGLKSVA